ncbi:hypothetical protein C491_03645 [Natronococcus amylolyticus DSM 10524]|uniref:Uncharacterized protein n=1 Tax=Natronococcus amylolyticus DSM 10524 TaxID=1227497 RepID=L9XFF9_9EURY|nr:hypothetical protein [Natronococcus amylolyticus]ELY60357.1 hypothetical protein C491_03645 [Natronococcus amylolyticus DSM 10524]
MSARIGIALIAVAIALLITASAGASVVSMDRSIAVEVVDDENANVAVEPVEAEVPDNAGSENANESAIDAAPPLGERELLSVSNRLDEEITVTELETSDGVEIEGEEIDVGPGNSIELEGTVDCDELEEEPEATVELDGSGVTISQTVDLEVTCPSD